jgi:hypothetical protein
MHVRGLELAIGDPSDTSSAFQWACVELNLPGSSNYNPSSPRVRKIRTDGLTAVDMVAFFDDVVFLDPPSRWWLSVCDRLPREFRREATPRCGPETMRNLFVSWSLGWLHCLYRPWHREAFYLPRKVG